MENTRCIEKKNRPSVDIENKTKIKKKKIRGITNKNRAVVLFLCSPLSKGDNKKKKLARGEGFQL